MRYPLVILLSFVAFPFKGTQTPSKQEASPSVFISLPANISSETAQIRYFMTGPFGGYGGYAKPQPNLHFYQLDASAEGRPAATIKILVYAPNCKIQTFDLSFSQRLNFRENFVCEVLPKASLSGQVPDKLIQEHDAELVISYLALWANDFFGVADGAVPEFQLAIVSTNRNGMFHVELPDFSADAAAFPSRTESCFHLMLRDSKTWNPIALNLKPELSEVRSEYGGLKIQSSYPATLKFAADPAT